MSRYYLTEYGGPRGPLALHLGPDSLGLGQKGRAVRDVVPIIGIYIFTSELGNLRLSRLLQD